MSTPPSRPPLSSGTPKPPPQPPVDFTPVTAALGDLDAYIRELAATSTLNSTSQALENVREVKSGRGFLFGVSGFNSNTASQFVLIFDHDVPPQNGATASVVLDVAGSSTFTLLYAPFGRTCYQGIVVTNSTTAPTLTLGAADCFFDCQYL